MDYGKIQGNQIKEEHNTHCRSQMRTIMTEMQETFGQLLPTGSYSLQLHNIFDW